MHQHHQHHQHQHHHQRLAPPAPGAPHAAHAPHAEHAAGPQPVPLLDIAEEDPWRFGWLDSTLQLRRGLCVREAAEAWNG